MVTLPAGIGSVRDRWCLKLHGTCSLPESIVLTRRDYSVFAKEQAAMLAVTSQADCLPISTATSTLWAYQALRMQPHAS